MKPGRRGPGACFWIVLTLLLSAPGAGAQQAVPPAGGILTIAHRAIDQTLTTLANVPAETVILRDEAIRTWRSGDVLRAAIFALVLSMTGAGAEWLYWCYAGKACRAIAEAAFVRAALSPPQRATLGLRRSALGASGVALFVCGVLIPGAILPWPISGQAVVVAVVLPIAAARLARIVATLILSPHPARLRLVARPDRNARGLAATLDAFCWVLAGGFIAAWICMRALQAPGLAATCSVIAGLIAAGLAIAVLHLWVSESPNSSRTSIYPVALTTLVLICLALHLAGAHQIVSTVALLVAAIVAGNAAWPIVDAYTWAPDGTTSRRADYRPVIKSGVRILLLAMAILAALQVWDIPLLELLQSPTMTGQVLLHGVNVIVVVLVADLLWVWTRTVIDGKLATIPPRSDGADASARLATLLPLLRRAILVVLVALVGLSALPALGIAITPLLAGAGVVGIAVGLGAQTLVRDIVSGVFYLLEDSFRIGEYVTSGEISGTVESISLRSLRIRHHQGAVYSVPFGEIRWLVNLSRDWALMKLEFRVAFDTDVALAGRLIASIGAGLIADQVFGQHIIEPLTSSGIIRTEEFSIVLGVHCMTKPNAGRFDVRREAYHRIRDAFAASGIRAVHGGPQPPARHAHSGPDGHNLSVHEVSEMMLDTGGTRSDSA
jgi:small-conductance mechanosensitive channel